MPITHDADSLWGEWKAKITDYRSAHAEITRELAEIPREDPHDITSAAAGERIAQRVLSNVSAVRAALVRQHGLAEGRFHEALRLGASPGREMMMVYRVPDSAGQALDARFTGLAAILDDPTARSLAAVYVSQNMPVILRMFSLVTERTQARLNPAGGPRGSTTEEVAARNLLLAQLKIFREDLAALLRTRWTRAPAAVPAVRPVRTPAPARRADQAPVPIPTPEPLDPNEDLDITHEELFRAIGGITEMLAQVGAPRVDAITLSPDDLDVASLEAITLAARSLDQTRERAFEFQRESKRHFTAAAEWVERIGARHEHLKLLKADATRTERLNPADRRTLDDATGFAERARSLAGHALAAVKARLDLQAERLAHLAHVHLSLLNVATALSKGEATDALGETLRNDLRKLQNL